MKDEIRYRPRPIHPYTEGIIARAMDERFTIDACPSCGGPRIYSKISPKAKCFGCGLLTETRTIRPAARKVRCDTCRKFFFSKIAFAECPACKEKQAKAAKIAEKWGDDVPQKGIVPQGPATVEMEPVIIEDSAAQGNDSGTEPPTR